MLMISEVFHNNGLVVTQLPAFPQLNAFLEDIDFEAIGRLQDEEEFRCAVLDAQERFNSSYLHHKICWGLEHTLASITNTDDLMISGVAFMRVVRPRGTCGKFEYLDFHRESFYATGEFVNHQINIHVPLRGYGNLSAMQYIPLSHLINDEEFLLDQIPETETGFVRGSSKHLGGLMYRPKKIVSGVDLDSAVPLPVRFGEAAIFSSKLIHGGGVNHTQNIRVSVDFAIIPSDCVQNEHNFQLAATLDSKHKGDKYVPLRTKVDSSHV